MQFTVYVLISIALKLLGFTESPLEDRITFHAEHGFKQTAMNKHSAESHVKALVNKHLWFYEKW